MKLIPTLCVLGVCGAVLGACSSGGPKAVEGASARQKAAGIDQLKSLAGTWDMRGHDGASIGEATFSVTSAGSAVREVMFVGQKHEMTNMYTMEGAKVAMTHYCAMGNQPHLLADTDGAMNRIVFKCAGVGNLTSPKQQYMGDLTLIIKDHDHVTQDWQSYVGTKPSEERTVIELVRKPA